MLRKTEGAVASQTPVGDASMRPQRNAAENN